MDKKISLILTLISGGISIAKIILNKQIANDQLVNMKNDIKFEILDELRKGQN